MNPLPVKALPCAARCLVGSLRAGKVLLQNLLRGVAIGRHGGCAFLAQAHAVAPTAAVKQEAVALLAHLEPCAGNLVPPERLADGQPERLGGDLGCVEAQRDGAA